MKTVCKTNMCTGCMACVDLCPKSAISIKDDLLHYNAVIDGDKCIECDLCHKICQNNRGLNFNPQIDWYQGWAKDDSIRMSSSSGGVASALAKAVIAKAGCVYSCVFSKGEFVFKCAENYAELKQFVGSKYVKSNPKGIYKQIKEKLKSGKDILFIGLPCQVAALKIVTGENAHLFTVDLICHGSPSPKLLDIFLNQYGIGMDGLSDISFRVKNRFQLSNISKQLTPPGVRDRYLIAFLNGLIFTENCYECKFTRKERVSDITIGDSWGSNLDEIQQKKGVSLLLIQTEKGRNLLKEADVELFDVDINKSIEANHQLEHPSVMPEQRKAFFDGLSKGRGFNSLVKKCYPKQCIKQDIKAILNKLKIRKWGAIPDYRIMFTQRDK